MKSLLIFALCALASTCAAQMAGSGKINITGKQVADVSNVVIIPADYYVCPSSGSVPAPFSNGSDSNNGKTVEAPFATLDHARSAVRSIVGTKPLTIMACGGTFYNTTTSFAAADSGTAANPVVWENYPGQTPVFSGGVQLSGSWSNITGQAICNGVSPCWQMTLPNTTPYFEALWYNGVRRARPRTGASAGKTFAATYGIYPSGGSGASMIYTASDPDMSSANTWTNLSDVEMYDCEKWVCNILHGVSSINTSTQTVTWTCNPSGSGPGRCPAGSGPGAWKQGNNYVFENVKQLLRYPGQWYLDRSSNPWVLTYLGNPGENPNTDTVVVGSNAQVVNASGWNYWTMSGFQFQNDNYNVPAGGYQSIQLDPYLNYTATTSQGLPSAAFSCTSCAHFTFSGNTVTQTVLSGVEFEGTSTNGTISGNLLYDIGAYGIKIGSGPQNSDTNATVTQSITVTNNRVAGVGRFLPTADGIMLGDVHDITVTLNDVGFSYHDAIEVCKPVSGKCSGSTQGTAPTQSFGAYNIDIEDNDLHNLMQGITDDGGGIYVQTTYICTNPSSQCSGTGQSPTGNKMKHNSIHDVNDQSAQSVNKAAWGSNGYGGHGVYMDSDTGLWDVENNLIYRVSANGFNMTNGPQVSSQPNTGKNNILAFTMQSVAGVQACSPASNVAQMNFTNSIVLQDHNPTGSGSGGEAYAMQKAPGAYFYTGAPTAIQDWANNYYYLTVNGGYCVSGTCSGTVNPGFFKQTTNCGSPSVFSTFSAWQSFGEDSGSSVTTNPGFVLASVGCTIVNDPNWPYPDPGVCDDWRFSNGTGPGANFTAFNVGRATSSIPGNGFGSYSGLSIPSVLDTFLTATYPVSQF